MVGAILRESLFLPKPDAHIQSLARKGTQEEGCENDASVRVCACAENKGLVSISVLLSARVRERRLAFHLPENRTLV